jgi:hypothetical protein
MDTSICLILEDLNLRGCKGITDDGMRHLSGLTNLKKLNLRQLLNVKDAGMVYLDTLKSLEVYPKSLF